MINDDDVRAVRAATNIVGVIAEYVQLRRVGRRWVGLCPFHTEKSGSFSVNEAEGLYYCFGCQAKGDAITFVREVENLDFTAAVERLAAKANITLRYTDTGEAESRKRRHRLVEVVAKAVDFYHERLLTAADAGPARGYLRSRGITGEQVRQFRLGWAPDDWDQLARHLRVPDDVLRDSGLGLINKRGRQQDFFRGRVLFPIFDPQGDPIGFGGRLLPGAAGGARQMGGKYVNPGGTPIYDKSKVLYGLHWAKADIVQVQEAVICEGYTDVMGFFSAGVPRAVATCGTALTEDHVRLLTRFANRLVLAFDADGAGQAAAERFHQWEQAYDLDVRVAALPPGVDPADLARTDPEALRRSVTEAKSFLAFRLDRVWAAADLATPEGRARAADHALDIIRQHRSPLVQEQYLLDAASRCRLDAEVLRRQLALGPRSQPTGHRGRNDDRGSTGSTGSNGSNGPNWSNGPNTPGARRVAVDRAPLSPRRAAAVSSVERDALRVAADAPAEAAEWLDPVLFADGAARRALAALLETGSLAAALDHLGSLDDAEATEVLHQAAVEQSDATIHESFLRLCQQAAGRAMVRLAEGSRTAGDPLAATADITILAGWRSTLLDDDASADTKLEAGTDLLAWLLGAGEGA